MIGQILWRGTPTSQNSSSTSSNPHILHSLLFSLRVLKTASLSFNFIAFKINSSQNSFRCFTSSCNVFRSSLVLNFPGLQESTDGPVGADLYRACLYSNSQSDPRCKSGKQTNLNNEQWTPRVFKIDNTDLSIVCCKFLCFALCAKNPKLGFCSFLSKSNDASLE